MAESAATEVDAYRLRKLGALILLYLPLFTVGLGYGAILPILPGLLERFHGTRMDGTLPLHAGLLTGLYIGAFVIAAPLWGQATDRRGPRLVMVMGLVGYAAATVWFGVVGSLGMAYVARFVAGAFAAGLVPATSALIVSRYRGEERVQRLAWVSAASVVGFLFGPALTGWVHDVVAEMQVSPESGLHIKAVPVWTTAAIALLAAVGAMWSVGPGRRVELASDRPSFPNGRPTTLALHSVLYLSGFGAFGLGAFEVGLSLQSQRAWQFSPSELGSLFVACSLVMLIIQFALYEPLQRLMRAQTLVTGGFAVMAAGFALLSSTSGYAWILSLVAMIAAGSGMLLPTLSVATANAAGARIGSATGIQNAVGNLGQAAGSAAAGLLFSVRPVISFPVVAAVMLAIALETAWSGRLKAC